ncbi:recombinase zinc beta ribbon domain-containing protein [Thioclava litoralis]|uniref:Recombinase zinc beta ribbon domain-containing protein n=1 Tax=Thioclava litoralis TaxID=3076557 RepID=A0ABZ1E451_9RHOB|nr:recombinase zinc beta ribbon domain-containing protein [Thioclava sp. FTW29]
MKDPASGKRQARLNPPEEWVIKEVEHLRIIEDDLWRRVKARQDTIREEMNHTAQDDTPLRRDFARQPKFLLSGLIKCGCCSGNYILINRTRYGCSVSLNKGLAVCDNRATIRREDLEARVLGGLKDRLMHPELIALFVEE